MSAHYSQNDEQEIILSYFGEHVGTFADIGACNGLHCSNTRALFEKGWRGLFVDADPPQCAALMELYRGQEDRAFIFCGAVSDRGMVEPFWAGGGGTSTLDRVHMLKWRDYKVDGVPKGAKYRKIFLRTVTVDDLLIVWSPPWEFLNIDIEGEANWRVLKHMDLKTIGCRMLCIEWDGKPEIGAAMVDYCKPFGLNLVHRTPENLILAL